MNNRITEVVYVKDNLGGGCLLLNVDIDHLWKGNGKQHLKVSDVPTLEYAKELIKTFGLEDKPFRVFE